VQKFSKIVLETKKLQKTPCRIDVLEALNQASTALSEQEIKDRLHFDYDRATLFRTLRTFLENSLIHQVVVQKNEVKYALNQLPLQLEQQVGHAHFHCDKCNKVFCLDAVSRDLLNIPKDFQVNSFEIMFNGFCAQCRAN
jgi:Fur family ferric uptake transcriptional regulator